MRIALDARCLNAGHVRGMGKFVRELLTRLPRFLPVRWELLADRPDLPFHAPDTEQAGIHLFECKGYRFHSWEQWALPRRAARLGADVLHCPGTRVPWWQPRPTVVTVHDVLPWLGDEPDWPAGWYLNRLLPRAFAKCHTIVTDSDSSRRDLVRLWPQLENKVRVIPLGVGDAYFAAEPAPLGDALTSQGIRQPYLLYLGGRVARKRLDWALRILEALADTDVTLAVCGLEREAEAEVLAKVRPDGRERLRLVPFVPEDDMPRLYQNAAAVLYPTLYEGFGFPVLEAQAVGTPVLHSAVGSLTELVGPGSVVLPAEDLQAWAEACRRHIAARVTNAVPHDEAREWARRFTWDTCAARYAEVYESAARCRSI